MASRIRAARWAGLVAIVACTQVQALEFEFGSFVGTLDSRFMLGGALRAESADPDLIGKLNLDPDLCGDTNCLSFSGDPSENQKLVDAPGAFFGAMKDDGTLNYDRGDLVSAVFRISEDLSMTWRDRWRIELGLTGYFDPVNEDFDETHPDTTFQPARTPRKDGVARTLGLDAKIDKAFVSGEFELFEQPLTLSVGYQRVRWGESTYIALNSIDQINPPSQVLMHQPGTKIADIFRPVPLVLLNAPLSDNLTLELLYELAWQPAELDPGGSFNAFSDYIEGDHLVLAVGQAHEDPDGLARWPFPVNTISETSFTVRLLDESTYEPRDSGQFGAKLSWYLEDFNGGTELSLYALNYHSQLPYFSAIAAQETCARDSRSFVQAFVDCKGFVGFNPATGLEPLPIDSFVGLYEYPEDIQMFGVSFNTNVAGWSLAGEYVIRPELPLQVALTDVAYAGLQPAFPERDLTLGVDPNTLAQILVSLPDIVAGGIPDPALVPALANALPTLLQIFASGTVTIPSARSAIPDFLSVYRGQPIQPGQLVHGYERFPVDQIGLTALRLFGASNPLGADQVLLLAEVGATHIWDLPSRSRLQIEGGDINATHASPGADGTGSGGEPDARRFTPTQQTGGFATEWSWGYRVSLGLEYNDLLWGMNLKPSFVWMHDVHGIAPQPMQNFIEGAMQYVIGTAVDAGNEWSAQLLHHGYAGGGTVNSQKDRDIVALSLAYAF